MKYLVQKIKKAYFKYVLMGDLNDRYVRQPAIFASITAADPGKIFVIVVAFNEPQLIAFHFQAMQKFCRDSFAYFVMDNSNQPEAAAAIQEFCVAQGVNYVRLPKNPGIDGSTSHGFALNWAFHNIIRKFRPITFGTMDSDFFPTEAFSIGSFLEKGDAWGVITERRPLTHLGFPIWYLWAGCAFFRLDRFRGKELNFLPSFGVDTAGRIHVDASAVKRLPGVYDLHRDRIAVAEIPINDSAVSPAYAYGSFVHLTGASWKPGSFDAKRRWVEKLLEPV